MKLHLHIIPQEIIDKYALHDLVDKDGWVYLKFVKGMYGLKQAGIIANMELSKNVILMRLVKSVTCIVFYYIAKYLGEK